MSGAFTAWPAPAKLNLFLHILGRRTDGYHELQTLFQLLDWGDEVRLQITSDGRIERVGNLPGVPAQSDLAVRAARALQAHCGVRAGALIDIHKRIPLGSGLAGGSSDAATTLVALNELWGCGLSKPELAELGLALGADVPVFVLGRSAWAEGVGERLEPLRLGTRHYVLIFPGLRIATAEVFADPHLPRDTPAIEPARWRFESSRNDCEAVVLARHPELREVMQAAAAFGSPRLTGTGSCIFLPAEGENAARGITTALKPRYNVRAVRGVDHSPLLARLSADA
ncbi:MAG: 4-(cytidine 5'-diphospho)-2-C-methyl-D-erythritol kinase [Xanthomonadales bacterium]|nr:4-(cytidine 5'-diphospho)-2-C-methyl-D-erythritol kinase [Xanthomonadales bacterium]NIN59151.1 4-(cytidine 5'-diphospho)-2-C-methyl-D-erythritol kinase [Xanthomonadales bacterium]NIN74462.1 4-(cytidine 5'-diphospho)-2-C-methyl-D-erythritol kinase [Xanthomonadales bacterium]NIO13265.1 4-(cytidine 5'-diphospho)-2-C-methyl-D-erythritol kinase [Xanthomonadales bacterium]NIP11544.1 4-(cytidine 5'-diphospho)-2-C-methyl-D-erythritol kinase [Xanthomonadales bacterium]